MFVIFEIFSSVYEYEVLPGILQYWFLCFTVSYDEVSAVLTCSRQ